MEPNVATIGCCPASLVPLPFGGYPGGMPLAREQRKLAAIVAAERQGEGGLMAIRGTSPRLIRQKKRVVSERYFGLHSRANVCASAIC
jgi:hypothetical protein